MPDYTFAITGQDLSGPAWKTFVENVKKANQQVSDLKKPADEVSDRFKGLEGVIEKVKKSLGGMGPAGEAISGVVDKVAKVSSALGVMAKAGAVGGVIAFAAKELYDYGEGLQKAASEIAKLAGAHNLTANEVQALQDLARRTGKTFEELAGTVGKNKLALDTLTQAFVATGQAIDTNVIAKVAEMEWKSKEASERMAVHFGKINAVMTRLYVEGKSTFLEGVANYMDSIARSINSMDLQKLAILTSPLGLAMSIDKARADQSAARGDGVKAALAEEEKLEKQLAEKRANPPGFLARQLGYGSEGVEKELAKARARTAEERKRQDEARKSLGYGTSRGYAGPDPFGEWPNGVPSDTPKPTITGTGGGGGGGRTDDDMLEAQIKRYEALGSAATRAIGSINTERSKSLEDMQREVAVQRQIDEIVGKLGAKYTEASQAQKDRLYAAVSGAEMERAAGEKLMQSHVRADATQRQFGNGMLQFVQTQQQLKEAFDTGRLSTDAYANAIKALDQNTEDLRLKNIGLQGGLPALAAGFENARVQSERANNMFATGGRIYEQVMSTMTMAQQSWGQSFDQVLANAASSWARFLADIAMRQGTSQLFSLLGGTSGYNPGEAETLSIVGSGGGGLLSGIGSWFTGLFSAGGGPVRAGQPSIVGEYEPELWVPNTGGNILNRQQLQALGVGSGGGGSPIIVQMGGVSIGEFVSPSQHRRDMMEVQRRAEAGAIAGLMKMQRSGDRRMRASGFN